MSRADQRSPTRRFHPITGRTAVQALFGALLTAALAGQAHAQCQTTATTAETGRCWQKTLTANQVYANPYRDVRVDVAFSKPGATSYAGVAFWDGGNTFRFRTAFPADGTWTWTTSCPAGSPCDGDTGLETSGTVAVAAYAQKHPLYFRGFLKVNTAPPNANRYLANADGKEFYWLGDTAWAGPLRATVAEWNEYLGVTGANPNNRTVREFTVIQTALPVDWMRNPGVLPTDAAGRAPFTQVMGCTSSDPQPNSCSRWDPLFWQAYDAKIQAANDQGFVVMLVGLMERVIEGGGGGQPYPKLADQLIYARNVAARLSGNFVVFSPAFDTRPDLLDLSQCTPSSTQLSCRMRYVGQEIKAAAPRHLVTNHWGGGTPVAEMQPFQAEGWLDFQLFQSGQAASLAGCDQALQLHLVTQRARELPLVLWTYTPTKPNINGEAIYDAHSHGCLGTANYNPYRARQTGYLSLLSGATGYTFGVKGVWDWGKFINEPLSIDWRGGIARRSTTEMQISKTILDLDRLGWQRLVPEHGRIRNQAPEQHRKMALARDANGTFLIAYLPNNQFIKIGFANLPNVPRSGHWYNPRVKATPIPVTGVQDPSNPFFWDFTRPICPGTGDPDCPTEPDWVLVLD